MAALSGQKAIATAGTELALVAASQIVQCPVAIRAMSANTGYMYIGHDGAGAVASTTGYQLAAGDQIILQYVYDLYEIFVDSSVNGEAVCWLLLSAGG